MTITGEWGLVSIDGDPLPVRIIENPTDTSSILEGTLTFEAGHTYELDVVIEYRYQLFEEEGLIIDTIEGTEDGEWSRSGDDVILETEFFGQEFADTLYLENGRLVGRGGIFGEYVYERND